MDNFPQSLEEWNYKVIKDLVDKGYFETEFFDFDLGDLDQSPNRTKNIQKKACSFANSQGGFIVIGVKDRQQGGNDRIIGCDSNDEVPRKFGDKLSGVTPTLYFTFKNPPISIDGISKVLHVVFIPESPEKPHWTGDKKFYFRTNRGCEEMDYYRIKDSFLKTQEKRIKIKILYDELDYLIYLANGLKITDETKIKHTHSVIKLQSLFTTQFFSEILSIISFNKDLVSFLYTIRHKIDVINNKIDIFLSKVVLPISNIASIVEKHNRDINNSADELIGLIKNTRERLERDYPFVTITESL